jgi:hypothetical protein
MRFFPSAVVMCGLSTLNGCTSTEGPNDDEPNDETPALSAAKILIEHNATDEDTGFQLFADGDPWDQLEIVGPSGRVVLANTQSAVRGFGLTEFFVETEEPPNDEVPVSEVLAHLPEGTYTFRATLIDGSESSMEATLTYDIPAGPVLLSPDDGADDVDPNEAVVAWEGVTRAYDGRTEIEIVGYQVIVEKVESQPAYPQGFARSLFSIYLPASARELRVPPEFLEPATLYSYEVLAIEVSGNQTLASARFSTGPATEPEEIPHEAALTSAKLLIEHNATDEDTGFQGFADGDGWKRLTIGSEPLLVVRPTGTLESLGLTEFFFETNEPPNDEVPIPSVLSRIPENGYPFKGEMIPGSSAMAMANLSHRIPAGPRLLAPMDGSNEIDPMNAVVSWEGVTRAVNGSQVRIVGYELIVEEDAEPRYPQGFSRPWLSVHVPAHVTTVSIPSGFLEPGGAYKYEVLAIEENGNQTLSSAAFSARE